nr:MAG TPA: hypothetical protein [Caudoviricetes sp.]
MTVFLSTSETSSRGSTWLADRLWLVFFGPSQVCDCDFRFDWRTFRWNHAVFYPLEAISLLLTT